ncbi:DegV family protein [Corynebacterium sp. 335C]
MTAGRVEVVVDDTSCLTEEKAAAHGITMLPLPLDLDDDKPKTSALQPLPLAVTYARAQERAKDAGVLALHLSKALSSTWQNARTAAAAVGRCEAPDTATVGAALGLAAIAAAEESAAGGDLESCLAAAEDVLRRSRLWIYVPKLDAMRRGGRISAGQAVLSTALSIKPVIGLSDGALHVEAKCRTEAKALETIVDRCIAAAGGRPARAVVQHSGDADLAAGLCDVLELKLPAGSEATSVDLPPALIAHAGPEACAVSLVVADGADDPDSTDADGASDAHPADAARTTAGPDGSPLVTTVTSKLPTWSANRRAAKERAEALQRAIAELALRDKSDPEGARFGADAKRESGASADQEPPAADADSGERAEPGTDAGHAGSRDDASRDD